MPPPTKYTLRTDIYAAIEPEQFNGALRGKVALVTGSGRGIGREIAIALSKAGAAVAVTGRTKHEVDSTAKHIADAGGKAIAIVADGLKTQELERLVEEVNSELGDIDILVCNAGTNTFLPFHLTDATGWWYEMELMVRSPVELTRMVLPSFRRRNSGTIIYTSSRASKADLPWTTAYNCAKTSITRFAGTLQAELDALAQIDHLESSGVDVFSIHPGEVETSLHQTAFPEKTQKEAPYVIEHMERVSKGRPHFSIALSAWTCVYLSSGRGKGLRGTMVDCTQDVEEACQDAESSPRPVITNSCA